MQKKIISAAPENISSLKKELENILARQRKRGFILPGEISRRKIQVGIGKRKHWFQAVYSSARQMRRDAEFLRKYKIIDAEESGYYEYPIDNPRQKNLQLVSEDYLAASQRRVLRRASFLNSNEEDFVAPVFLHNNKGVPQKFFIGASYAPLGQDHLIAWASPSRFSLNSLTVPNQTYQGLRHLYWLDELLTKINDPQYRIFFNASGTGNTANTLHFQIVREKFPVFVNLYWRYQRLMPDTPVIPTGRKAWPFTGFFASYTDDNRAAVLYRLDSWIDKWLKSSPNNTFNLLGQLCANGSRELFFVKRKNDLCFVDGRANAFSGYETAGNIMMEDYGEFLDLPGRLPALELKSRATALR